MEDNFKSMEKGELHVHLNGLVSTRLVIDLLQQQGAEIPDNFDLERDLTRFTPSPDLQTYLKPWQVLRLIPQGRTALNLMVFSAFENLAAQNVKFVELRSSIIYLALLNNVTVPEALLWLTEEIYSASLKYGIRGGLILTISRGDYAAEHLRTLLAAYASIGKPEIIVGLDLAGNEDTVSPTELPQLYRKAKSDLGLKITIHAGETGNPQNIIEAITEFDADRIGHGTAAFKSTKIMELMHKRDICIEVCPISNRLTGAVKSSESHPVREFIKFGVPFVICSDNPAIHGASISDDYNEFYKETENSAILENMLTLQKKYSFMEDQNEN
ncbi:adenosine deaminase family protein [Pseudomonas lundensis]|uniref:adenosine deaminase family protein n=1 Tax=Pseudomonas lundensis TaxID=86185 RepID=UPI0006547A64|nr:adenosine deaminase [Pseudomonas lundensis]KMM88060.1 adenosine deaminase [Pseudomonas lundensis]